MVLTGVFFLLLSAWTELVEPAQTADTTRSQQQHQEDEQQRHGHDEELVPQVQLHGHDAVKSASRVTSYPACRRN